MPHQPQLPENRPRGSHSPADGLTHSFSLGKLPLAHNSPLVDAILLDDLTVVEHVKLLCRILAREEHDCLLAARMVSHKVGHVVDLLANDNPAVRLRCMLGHLSL